MAEAISPDLAQRICQSEAENIRLRGEVARLEALLAERSGNLPQTPVDGGRSSETVLDLQSILDRMPSMIGYWGRDQRNRFANHAYREWFGIDPEQMPQMSIREVIGDDLYRQNLPYIEAVLRGEPQIFERAIPSPDGAEVRYSLAEYLPDVADGEVRGFYVLVSDVSLLKKAEAALAASETRYRAVLEDQTEVICRLLVDGTFVFANDVYCRYFGKPASELLGRKWQPAVHPADIPEVEAKLRTLTAENPVVVIENRVYAGNGELRWMQFVNRGFFDAAGGLAEIQCVGRDIHARREAEEQLYISEERLRLVAKVTRDGIWDWNLRTNETYLTPRCYELTGYRPEQITPDFAFFKSTIHADDWDYVQKKVDASLQGKTGVSEFACRMIVRSGEIKWIEGKGQVVERDAEGAPLRMVGTISDITERKLALDELGRSRTELRALAVRLQSVREDERRRIAREIHDDLGQRLSAMKMDAIWLHDRLPRARAGLAGKVREMANNIHDAIGVVRRISQEMHPAILDTLDLASAIEWQVSEFRKRMGIRCGLSRPDPGFAAPGELTIHVFRICQELLNNIARHAGASRVDVSLALESGILVLSIADNGRGMSSPSADRQSLGLVSVRERAGQLAGSVEIVTAPSIQGTRVTVRIPLPQSQCGENA